MAALRSVPQSAEQVELPFDDRSKAQTVLSPPKGLRAIESESFPFEAFSDVAELESWRKEISRPLSHIHKWWAQRLGTVFRAIILGALTTKDDDVRKLFYRPVRTPKAVIYDPFMGSGTTLIETVKLGARAIGRDINSVACFLVRNALTKHNRAAVIATFRAIERDVAAKIQALYTAKLPDGSLVPVLYYFWVKTVPCPKCESDVDLFSRRVFAQHAYAKKHPRAQAVCPHCGGVNEVRFDATKAKCSACSKHFNPNVGPAKGQSATCPCCSHRFSIAKTARMRETPPSHRLYAKLVLMPDGRKAYVAADDYDRELFAKGRAQLARVKSPFPSVPIAPGYNTDQALNYNYRYWHQFFNERQLLALSILSRRIAKINDTTLRELFTCLFSGALEFNNMFTSFKGEGTGAVRHMFSHHILKPERTPLEANLWGTPKSSGSFSTMFESRILRALEYADAPFELRVTSSRNGKKASEKVFGLSDPIGYDPAADYQSFSKDKRQVYLSCGNSSKTDIRAKSVDLVVSDPPFFDNVHYSQLADFFHVWQRNILGAKGAMKSPTTRSRGEVQHRDPEVFKDRLSAVWSECHRVLKDKGLLIFTYHHSRGEGWRSVLDALLNAGFGIVAVHPIKSEMSVAAPKQQAKEPIDLDIIIVCRKLDTLKRHRWNGDLLGAVSDAAAKQIARLRDSGRRLSRNDVRIILMSQLLQRVSLATSKRVALRMLDECVGDIEDRITAHCRQD